MTNDLNELIIYVAALLFIVALIAIGAWALKWFSGGRSGGVSFLRGRERRLGVIEAVSMDARRKLVLIKRDDVEHLIMIGGPIDLVIETGIASRRAAEPMVAAPASQDNRDRIVLAPDEKV